MARIVDQPEAGFFEMRLVRGGPMVAARIHVDDGVFTATVDGVPSGSGHADAVYARHVCWVWNSAISITEAEYNFRIATKEWAICHDPTHPAANPRKKIDLKFRKSLF